MDNGKQESIKNVDVPTMLKKLDSMYEREEELIKELEQLQEDKECLQMMIMYKSNKLARLKK